MTNPFLGRTSVIAPLQPAGRLPPLFLVHGVAGGMLDGYARLSRHLAPEQPLYAFRSRGLMGEPEFDSLPAMAAHYVRHLRASFAGPYRLGGFCFGGNVAYEMACQLRAAGEPVALVALINSSPPNSRYDEVSWSLPQTVKFVGNLYYWTDSFLRWDSRRRRQFISWKLRKLRVRLGERLEGGPEVAPFNPDDLVDLRLCLPEERELLKIHVSNLAHYRNSIYDGRVTLFRTPGHPMFCSFDRSFGWSEFASGGTEVRIVPGTHECLMGEPHVRRLAWEMQRELLGLSDKR